jgi:hypothetical protein
MLSTSFRSILDSASILHEKRGNVNRKRGEKLKKTKGISKVGRVYKKFKTFFKKTLDTRGRVWYNSKAWQSKAMIPEVAEIRIWAAGSSGGAVSDFKLDETELS